MRLGKLFNVENKRETFFFCVIEKERMDDSTEKECLYTRSEARKGMNGTVFSFTI